MNFIKWFLKKLNRAVHIHPTPPEYILSPQDIFFLFEEFKSQFNESENSIFSQHGLHGQKLSPQNGQGMDYSESRVYSVGDDFRSINWKQSARSNEMIVNQYISEQEPTDYLMIDMRASMYFGTVNEPKISLAFKQAIKTIVASIQSGHSIKLFSITDKVNYLALIKDYKQAVNIISSLSKYSETDTGTGTALARMHEGIQAIRELKTEHSTISIISDFNDVNSEVLNDFKTLKSRNTLVSYQIKDQIEINLPDTHPVEYCSRIDDMIISIETRTDAVRLKKSINEVNARVARILEQGSDFYHSITNDESFQA